MLNVELFPWFRQNQQLASSYIADMYIPEIGGQCGEHLSWGLGSLHAHHWPRDLSCFPNLEICSWSQVGQDYNCFSGRTTNRLMFRKQARNRIRRQETPSISRTSYVLVGTMRMYKKLELSSALLHFSLHRTKYWDGESGGKTIELSCKNWGRWKL